MLEVRAATRTRAARPWFGDSPWLACYHPFSAPNGVGLWGGEATTGRFWRGGSTGHPQATRTHARPISTSYLPALADAFIYWKLNDIY